uniref:DFDF domain-containing protein n=1 Tax=Hyaloperonospora arabidopsidis (strain Emoy2) TaxID=559515 RepID=M4BC25_HYAAE
MLPPRPPTPPPASQPPSASAPSPSTDGIPYLGSRISLISKTDIRYEGFLFNIDTRQSTVALQRVRSFGTEGRRAAAEHVPASAHVLQYATFKAAEIKDLHVCEAAPAEPPLPVAPVARVASTLLTPGSVSSQQTEVVESDLSRPVVAHTLPVSEMSRLSVTNQISGSDRVQMINQTVVSDLSRSSPQMLSEPAEGPRRQTRNKSRTIPGMGGHLLNRKERRGPGGVDENGAGGRPETASCEFNFEAKLSDFDKQQEFSKLEEDTKKESTGSYQKSSFFDTISCDALDRLEGQRARMTGAQERTLNTETFGAVGLNNRRNFRGRGRRGGYRNGGSWNGIRSNGGGRGGRSSNNNSDSNNGGVSR